MHILGIMNESLSATRTNMSAYAPRIITIKIPPDKIRDVIGKGGSTIRQITEQTGATIDIDDDGNVRIYGEDADSRDAAILRVQAITAEAEIGKTYRGKVSKIVDFGAFVTIIPGKDGLVHISQISNERVDKVSSYLSEGQEIFVKVLKIDDRGKISLSMKEVSEDDKATA
jgi:polyribonucleotide nucleotidyltransferase